MPQTTYVNMVMPQTTWASRRRTLPLVPISVMWPRRRSKPDEFGTGKLFQHRGTR